MSFGNRQRISGFTLIELMIVVAIIGILAAIAIPSYQDYTARSQVTEAVQLTSQFKTALTDYYASKGSYASANVHALGGTTAGKYVTNVKLEGANGGTIAVVATFSNASAAGIKTLDFALDTEDGGKTWACGILVNPAVYTDGNQIDQKYMPKACK